MSAQGSKTIPERVAKIDRILRDQYELDKDCPAFIAADLVADVFHYLDHIVANNLWLDEGVAPDQESLIRRATIYYENDTDAEVE